MTKRIVMTLTADELRDLLKRREEILVAEEREAVREAFRQATPEERAELAARLGWNPLLDD